MSMSKNDTHSSAMNNLSLVSWNVKGLGHVVKRGSVFAHLKSLKADITFLQETHIGPSDQHRLRANWISQVFQAPFTHKARGVAILIRKNIHFCLESMIPDPHGRYIMFTGKINCMPVVMLNIYGPNVDNPDFFIKVFNLIPATHTNIIVGGDFNCYLDSVLDRLSSRPPLAAASVQILTNLIKTRNLVDAWRLLNPTRKDF